MLDLSELSIEELSGCLSAWDGCGGEAPTETGGKLLLTLEQWASRQRQRPQGSPSSGGGEKGGKPKTPGGEKQGGNPAGGNGTRKLRNCCYCGKAGHWAKECRKAQRDHERKGEASNVTEAEADPPVLFLGVMEGTIDEAMDSMSAAIVISTPLEQHVVFLNEEHVMPVPAVPPPATNFAA